MTNNDILIFAITAGKIMLESGAETYRVEDTMLHIAQHFNIPAEVFATTTGVFISDGDNTQIRRISHRTIHLGKVAQINDISRQLVADKLTLSQAIPILDRIAKTAPYNNLIRTIATGLSSTSFTYIFGGDWSDCANALLTGLILNLLLILTTKFKVSSFMGTLLGGVIVALGSILIINLGLGNNIDLIIIGSIMPLVPGLGITNAIRDILAGDYLSGSGRMFDALIIAIALAVGVGFVLKAWLIVFGGFIL